MITIVEHFFFARFFFNLLREKKKKDCRLTNNASLEIDPMIVFLKTFAGFAQRLHLFKRFSDLTSGLDCEGWDFQALREPLCVFLPPYLRIYAA